MGKNSKRNMSGFFDNMLLAGDLFGSFLDKFIDEYEGLDKKEKRELYDLVCKYKPEDAIGAGVIGLVRFYIESGDGD